MAKLALTVFCITIGLGLGVRTWPGGRVPYQIEDAIDSRGRSAIQAAISGYQQRTCITFIPKGPNDRFFVTFYKGRWCYSPVGMNGRNRISLSPYCYDKNTVMFELSHALGLYHPGSVPAGTAPSDADIEKLKKMYNC